MTPLPARALLAAALAVAGVPPHAHCEVCGTPVAPGERRCGSKDCERRFAEAQKAKKRSVYMLVIVLALAMLFGFLGRMRG